MTRRSTFLALAIGALIAVLFVAVGIAQAYLVAHDQLHDQLGYLAMQLTWVVLIPTGLLIIWLDRHLAKQLPGISARVLASALAGFLGGVGCIIANVPLQAIQHEHLNESYPGVMPAFVLVSFLAMLVAGPLLGVMLGICGSAVSTLRSRTA
jgi:hypothetical protein